MTHNSSVTKDSKTSEVLNIFCIPAYASLDLFHFKISFKICCFLYGITIFSGSYRKNWLLPVEKNSNEGGYCESDLTLAGALLQPFLPIPVYPSPIHHQAAGIVVGVPIDRAGGCPCRVATLSSLVRDNCWLSSRGEGWGGDGGLCELDLT